MSLYCPECVYMYVFLPALWIFKHHCWYFVVKYCSFIGGSIWEGSTWLICCSRRLPILQCCWLLWTGLRVLCGIWNTGDWGSCPSLPWAVDDLVLAFNAINLMGASPPILPLPHLSINSPHLFMVQSSHLYPLDMQQDIHLFSAPEWKKNLICACGFF